MLTDGSKGTWDPASDTAALIATRQAEQRAAAHALGAHAVHFLGAIDGELEADAAMRRRVCELVRTVQPDVVLGHDPWKQYRLHPDHRHAGQARHRRHRRGARPALLPRHGRAAPSVAAPALRGPGRRPRRTGRSTTRWPPRSPRCCATGVSGDRPWASTRAARTPTRNAPRSSTGCAVRSTRPGAKRSSSSPTSEHDRNRRRTRRRGPGGPLRSEMVLN